MFKYEDLIIPERCLPDNYSIFPFTKDNIKGASLYSPIVFIPESLVPDEIFRPIIPAIVPNVCYDRYYISNYGRVWDAFLQRFLSYNYDHQYDTSGYNPGYIKVSLSYYEDPYTIKTAGIYLHRLVLKTFSYFPDCDMFQVNHKNGDHSDFRLSNLEWVTAQQNTNHAFDNSFRPFVKPDLHINIPDNTVHMICKYIQDGYTDSDIYNCTLIVMSNINQIRVGMYRPDISSQYNFNNYKKSEKKANLNDETVHNICKCLCNGMMPTEIANKFGIGRHIVNDIKFGRNYTYISSQYEIPINKITRISDMTIHKICQLLEQGYGAISISKQLNIPVYTVNSIKQGRIAKHISCKYKIPTPKQYTFINNTEVVKICEMLSQTNMSDMEIAAKIGCTFNIVRDIRLKRSYTDISKDYNW